MRSALAVGLFLLAACAATPKGALISIPSDTPAECAKICGGMGLQMTAVVVAASQVGCVCEKAPQASRATSGSAPTAAAAILASLAAVQQQDQQQQHRVTGTAPPQTPQLPPAPQR